MLTYVLEKTGAEPMYVQIYKHIKKDIENGVIKANEKLPSKRVLAENLGVSIITVENAYSQLTSEGYVKALPKRGYFAENISSFQSYVHNENTVSAEKTNVTSAAKDFPFAIWAKLMREELSNEREMLMTRPPINGSERLRCAIAKHIRQFRNIDVSPDRIVIGAGTEYLYMLINILIGEGRTFGVEDPGYSKISDIYSCLGAKCAYIPMESDGVDIAALKASGADIMHISPSHHFPTGVVTSVGKRYALLGWASEKEGRYIIEDDYDSEFRLSGRPIPSLLSIDAADRVIYMNTFSKSLSPTIRISYMVLPVSLTKLFRQKLSCCSCTVSTFEQYTLARFIDDGYFEKHINRVKHLYKKRRDNMLEKISQYPLFEGCRVTGQDSGLHCLIEFDTQLSDGELLHKVTKLGFHARLLSDYYKKKPTDALRTLIFYYD